MKAKPTVSITLLLLLVVGLVLSGCQNPLESILQRAPVDVMPDATEEIIATEEPSAAETEPPPVEPEPSAVATEAAETGATPTAAPAPTEEIAEVPTPEPTSAPAADMTFTPLSQDECSHIADILSMAFGVEFGTAEVAFQDFLTGNTGMGCAIQANGDGSKFDNPGLVSMTVSQQLAPEGWATDVQYSADGPTGTVVGLTKGDKLCILDANWMPSEDADCAPDQPISECDLTPEQKLFTVTLTCAQRSGEELAETDTGAGGEVAPTPMTGAPAESTAQAPMEVLPPPDQAHRIQFPPGGTSATIDDSVGIGEVDLYVLQAMAGQNMSVDVYAPKGNAVIAIWGADGVVLISDHAGAHNWSGPLPKNQDYYISVSAVEGTSTSYTLTVAISALTPLPTVGPPPTPVPTPDPGPQPIRIEFAPGTDAATVAGSVPAGGIARYVLTAQAQQTMSVNVVSATGNVRMAIWGADGTVLISDHAGATSWSGLLPLTQDYYIDVIAAAGAPANFTLQVIIPPSPGPLPEPPTKRISFAAGSISATESGSVAPGGIMRYLVGAMDNQTMSVSLNVSPGAAVLVIWGADGTVLLSDHAGATSWSGVLPGSQDYIIDVKSVGASPVNFTLQVTIPPL
jgi:hypothetical protein